MPKNAISMLQEYRQKHVQHFPVYTEMSSLTGSHQNTFRCQCVCDDHQVIGEGPSKKDAKIEAAKKMIESLRAAGKFDRIEKKTICLSPSSPASSSSTSEDSNIPSDLLNTNKISPVSPSFVNHVGMLQEMCVKFGLINPIYTDAPVADGFECTCTMGEFVGRGTGMKKKDAKQLSAEKLIKILTDKCPQMKMSSDCTKNREKGRMNMEIDEEVLNLGNLRIADRLGLKNLEVGDEDEEKLARENAKEVYKKMKKRRTDDELVSKSKEKNGLKNFHVLFKQSLDEDVLKRYHEYYKSIRMNDSTPKIDQLQNIFEKICKILGIKSETKTMKTDGNLFMIDFLIHSYPTALQEIGIGTTEDTARMNGLSRIMFTIHVLLM